MFEFQSLFYWITYSYRVIYPGCPKGGEFQSLFYWITYSYTGQVSAHIRRLPACFNPYFTGLPILIFTCTLCPIVASPFQSLFYWITYSYSSKYADFKKFSSLFQSLFYWITYSYTPVLLP